MLMFRLSNLPADGILQSHEHKAAGLCGAGSSESHIAGFSLCSRPTCHVIQHLSTLVLTCTSHLLAVRSEICQCRPRAIRNARLFRLKLKDPVGIADGETLMDHEAPNHRMLIPASCRISARQLLSTATTPRAPFEYSVIQIGEGSSDLSAVTTHRGRVVQQPSRGSRASISRFKLPRFPNSRPAVCLTCDGSSRYRRLSASSLEPE